MPSLPICFNDKDVIVESDLGAWSGVFGSVKIGRIPSITNEFIAVKTISLNESKSIDILTEAKVSHAVSGHIHFAFCYGYVRPNKILMQFLGKFDSGAATVHTLK